MEGIGTTVLNCKVIDLQTILRKEGRLSVVENLPFEIKRAYYIYDIPDNAIRGNHAHKKLYQLIVTIHGNFTVRIKDGKKVAEFQLSDPSRGLLVPPGLWRELVRFNNNAVCLVFASENYNEDDYIRDYKKYLKYKNGNSIDHKL